MRRLALPLFVVVALFGVPAGAQAATYTVNTTGDTAGTDDCTATCSLRDAVTLANANAGADTITLPRGTFTLTSGELPLATTAGDTITIDGAGARNTAITAGGASRVFDVGGALGVASTASLSGMTITGGNASAADPTAPGDGGGIVLDTAATLNLDHVFVTANTADDSGGGIAAYHTSTGGSVNIDSSLIAGNTAGTAAGTTGTGGGVFAEATLNLTNSTVSDNVAQGTTSAQGGGLTALATGASLVSSTIAVNRAVSAGAATGGGVANASSLSAFNTIVGDNSVNGAPSDCLTAATGTLANDLSSDTSCGFTGAGSKQGVSPVLGALADNGGPTDTRKPGAGSPALDAGAGGSCPPTDQRGVARPQGPACDIGAVELAPPRVATGVASRIHTTTAVLTGAVTNPLVQAAQVAYQWGRTTAYGKTATSSDAPAAASGVRTAFLTKLTPGATYHYRIVALSGDGYTVGADKTFTAAKRPGAKPFLKITGVPTGCRRSTFQLRLRSRVSGTGIKLRSVKVTLDGKKLKTAKKPGRFRIKVKAGKLKHGRHTLRIKATDTKGRVTSLKRSFRRCAAASAPAKT
jgi:CSLREA domain-containing protein